MNDEQKTNLEQSYETAEALLSVIRRKASGDVNTSSLLTLAQAYELVVGAMPTSPEPPPSTRGMVFTS